MMNNLRKTLIMLWIIGLLFCAAGCGDEEQQTEQPETPPEVEPEPEPEPDPIYNPLTGLEVEEEIHARIIAVSTDNHPAARPQSGISQADIVYEVPAEGNIPRFLALYYGQQPESVGPIRSARPYVIDIARGWGALFVHCGGSPDAYSYLSGPAVVSIDEIAYGSYFWRDYTLHSNEHTLYTSISNMYDYLEYREKPLEQEISGWLEFRQDGAPPAATEKADRLLFDYTDTQNIYVYDSESGLYARYIGEYPFTDANNGEQIKAANVIMQRVSSSVLDSAGRLAIDMCAGGEALLFSGGRVVRGTWSRSSLDANTQYFDANGNPFTLAPGQTWIQVCDGNVTVEFLDTTAPPAAESSGEASAQ